MTQNEIVFKTPIFDLEKIPFKLKDKNYSHYRILSPDWVNILPITQDKKAVLIRQYRTGIKDHVLELPGGIVEKEETKDPTTTAARELEEETGYHSTRILNLGSSYANPSIQNNRIHFFLAMDCKLKNKREHFPDETEDIKVLLYDIKELESLVRYGQLAHSYGCLGILLALKYLQS